MYELHEADILIKILNGYVSAISCVTYEEFRSLYSHLALSGYRYRESYTVHIGGYDEEDKQG